MNSKTKKDKPISIEYTIRDIVIQKFSTDNTAIIDKDGTSPIKIGLGANFNTDFENDEIIITIHYSVVSNNRKKKLCNLEVGYHFHIKGLNSKYRIEEDSIGVPDKFILDIMSYSVGTTRGIFIAKTEDTLYRKYYLPMIDIAKFVRDTFNGVPKSNVVKTKSLK
jgi:hypothetical protein